MYQANTTGTPMHARTEGTGTEVFTKNNAQVRGNRCQAGPRGKAVWESIKADAQAFSPRAQYPPLPPPCWFWSG
jgi:hypothetical protein